MYLRRNIPAPIVLKLLIPATVFGLAVVELWPQSPSAQTQEGAAGPARLELSQPTSRSISSGQRHQYELALQSNYYLHLTVVAPGIGLSASLSDPEGAMLVQTACHHDGSPRLSWITDHPGNYRLSIEACEMEQVSGNYKVFFDEKRYATAQDPQRAGAERLIVEAEKLRAQLNIAANREAVQKYQDALENWRAISDQSAEAETLRNIGQMLHERGERQSALRYFKQALDISRRAKEPQEESRILNDLGYLQTVLGNYKEALDTCSRALQLGRRINDRQTEAQALSNTAEAHHDLGKLRRALEYEQESLRIWQDLKDRRGQAQALLRRGYTEVSLGEMQTALVDYNQALQLFRAVKDYHAEALVLVALGHLYSETGNKQEALDYYDRAMKLSREMEDPFLNAELFGGTSYVYYELGDSEKALWYDEQALSLYRRLSDPWGEAAVHLFMGMIHHSMGAEQQALSQYRESAGIIQSLSNARLESYLLREMGVVYGQLGEQSKALDYYQRALSLSRKENDPRGEGTILNHIGRLYEGLDDKRRALNYFNQGLTLARKIDDRFAESFTLFNLAHVQRDLGDLQAAKAHIEAALRLVESLRTNVVSQNLRTTYLATVQQYYELNVEIFMRLHRQSANDGFDAQAFGISERARSRSLLEMLKEGGEDIRQGVDSGLLDQESSLQRNLDAKAERHMRLLAASNKAEAETVAKEIDQLTTEYDEVRSQIKSESPRYAALTQPQPLSLKEIQRQVLNDDSLLLEYMLGDERSYLWAVTRDQVWSYELPARTQIEDAARKFRDLLTANQPVAGETIEQRHVRIKDADARLAAESASFSKLVLGPVIDKLGTKRLLIVADGALQHIPFQALAVPATSSSAAEQAKTFGNSNELIPLLVEHEIVNQPSASALALVLSDTAQRKPAPNSIAVFANPVFEADDPRVKSKGAPEPPATESQTAKVQEAFRDIGFGEGRIPPLPASREEAEAIMAVAPWGTGLKAIGFDANRATISKPELAQYRIVHFATHGFVDYQHPELSGLMLSLVDQDGKPQDGFLRLHDIYNLKLSANLVVLSACNTGLGKEVKGEGLIGLTRGFMYAGAGGVAASLWKVDDDATAELMKHFYEGMFTRGLTPSAALREAQLGMWKQKRWHAPYYWAAFVIQGQYNQKETTGYQLLSRRGWVAAWVSLASTLLLAAFLLFRRRRKRIL